jgi:hypothetical protein
MDKSYIRYYDQEGDILYLQFSDEPPGAGYYLEEDLILWLDVESKKPVKLMIINFSKKVMEPSEKRRARQLDALRDLAVPIRSSILQLLQSPPLNEIIRLEIVDKRRKIPAGIVHHPTMSEVRAALAS